MADEDRIDELFKKVSQPALEKAAKEGKLTSWGWNSHVVGGKYRRLETLTGPDFETLMKARAEIIASIYGDGSNADAAEMLIQTDQLRRDELLQILADIKRDDLRASEVIKRLRALLARHDTERRRFNMNETVQATAGILRAEARRREVDVEYGLRAERADVLGDAVQIQQVIINLTLNAFDASAEFPKDARRVVVETLDTASGVQVSVRDFGIGIAMVDLPHVFDPFFSTKRSGMGLGLSIARSIVEAHGGTIAAASCAPGAEFRIILPLAPATDPARPSPPAMP
jgi:signal transduction histidine kinase